MATAPSHRNALFDDPNAPTIAVAHRTHRPTASCAEAPATHVHAALAYYTEGAATLDQRGLWRIEPGDVMLVPAGEPHRVRAVTAPAYWGVAFCAPCVAAEGGASMLDPFDRVRAGASPIVRIAEGRRAFVETLLRELEDLTRTGRTVDPMVPRSVLTVLLHEVSRAAPPVGAEAAGEGGVVAESLRYIERNCLRPLTLREVARAVHRSPAYVTTALTRATGRSAVAWIVEGRMAEARRRLAQSDEHIDVIAERVGYADATHFIRMFRRMHGATPAAWRASKSVRG